jgi:hypothetical protein
MANGAARLVERSNDATVRFVTFFSPPQLQRWLADVALRLRVATNTIPGYRRGL